MHYINAINQEEKIMNYPNAFAGVKKLVAAEALQIISSGLAIIVAILSFAALAGTMNALATGSEASLGGAVASGIGIILLGIAILVLGIISTVFTLIGLKKCAADEPKNFNIAFYCAIIVLVGSAIGGALSAVPIIANILKTLANICSIGTFCFTVQGISELANQCNRPDIAKLGMTILIIECVSILLTTIANWVGGIFAIIAAVLALVCYIIYLVYLTKAKAMLES